MAVDLDDVFACICARGVHYRDKDLVDFPSLRDDSAVVQCVALSFLERNAARGKKHFLSDCNCLWTAHANDSDSSLTERGRDSGDGVIIHHI